VERAFAEVQLNWRDHVTLSDALHRPSDIAEGLGNASKAAKRLDWRASWRMPQVVAAMIQAEQALQAGSSSPPRAAG
jgi:GDPmannose 4,6-dehydratase